MTSWTCYSASNNIHFDYPPIISDGRLFTSYQPEAVVNERIQKNANIQSNVDYRKYLQDNAIRIMNFNSLESCYTMGLEQHCNSNENSYPSNNVPYRFKSIFDTSKPGYGYCTSDLKSPYLSREQLNSRYIAPSISTNALNS